MSASAAIDVTVPGDKSLSHRALIFAALAKGESILNGVLDSADVRSTAECLRRLGVGVPPVSGTMIVHGTGAKGLRDPAGDLDCGNSGTTARLFAGLVAGARRSARFVGDASLSKRPMKRVTDPLQKMGAQVAFEHSNGLPMRIAATALHGIDWTSPAASAQVKSALLLAGVCGRVAVTVREPARSRDHTERMLRALGVPVVVADTSVALPAHSAALPPLTFDVPGDPSSAAFFAAWALLARTPVAIRHISVNPTRIGFFEALSAVGANVRMELVGERCGEPVGHAVIRGELDAAFSLEGVDVPRMIDELPLVACLGAYAPGETRVSGAAELRVKESDRIAAVVSNLRTIGADADELPDGFVVRGSRRALKGRVTTHGDHRIAMAFGVLGAIPGNDIVVDDPDCVAVSFPTFWADLDRLRARA